MPARPMTGWPSTSPARPSTSARRCRHEDGATVRSVGPARTGDRGQWRHRPSHGTGAGSGRRPTAADGAAPTPAGPRPPARLRAEGIAAPTLAADLADAGATRQAAATALAMLGGVDILVNAAGSNLRRPFLAVTPESWATELALHLAAPFFLTQAL